MEINVLGVRVARDWGQYSINNGSSIYSGNNSKGRSINHKLYGIKLWKGKIK
jgi:hypothetical protein